MGNIVHGRGGVEWSGVGGVSGSNNEGDGGGDGSKSNGSKLLCI